MSEPLRVALVVMPFASSDRPSLALGLLKAALARVGVACEVKYFNLTFWRMLGHERYERLSNSPSHTSLIGEWVFSQVFYGQSHSRWDSYEREVLDHPYWGLGHEHRPLIGEALALAPTFLRVAFESNDWSRFDVVGFTSTFEQTMASLCLARMIRAAHPQVRIVLGGANFEAEMGAPYLEHFEFVDYVATGEADRSFPALCSGLARMRAEGRDELPTVPGILTRSAASRRRSLLERATPGERPEAIEELDRLPTPDYTEYFEIAAKLGPALPEPWLMLETSRGCWWGRKHHCTFCGLNGETMTFRRKRAQRVEQEVDELIARHGEHRLQFADNILAHEYFADLLPRWAARERVLPKFFEIKANLRRAQVELLAAAGIVQVQPGIESLDDATLDEMDKGVSAAQNVALLRWCTELGVRAYWNILYGFPRELPDSLARQQALLVHLVHLPPPSACALIRLDRFSPNHAEPERHGFAAVEPLPAYRHVFPFDAATLARLAYFFGYDHPGLAHARAAALPLIAFVRRWRDAHARGRAGRLQIEQGGEGFVLVDDRLDHPAQTRPLEPLELALMLACDRPLERTKLQARADEFGPGGARALERLRSDAIIVELGDALVCAALLPSPAQLAARRDDAPAWLRRAG